MRAGMRDANCATRSGIARRTAPRNTGRPHGERAGGRAEPDRAFKRAFDDAAQFDIGLILSDDIGFFIASFGVWPFFMPPFAM